MEDIEFEDNDTLDELELGNLQYSTTFLKVLCILTLIGSGLFLFYFCLIFLNVNNLKGFFSTPIGFGKESLLFLWILPCIFCITGAIIMLFRNKIGYIIYVVGGSMPIIYGLSYAIYYKIDLLPTIMALLLRYVVNIGFIIMYSTQLYVMKPLFKKQEKSRI